MEISQLSQLEEQSIRRSIPIIGSEKGKWLLEKVKELQPKKILELGTANGYSGIILGSEGAELTTIEIAEKAAEEAMQNFAEFGINAWIILGDAVKVVKELVENHKVGYYDLILIDLAKRQYIDILENCVKLVKRNGFIITDNISSEKCADFREAVLNNPKLKTERIDIGDGLIFSEKVEQKSY